MEYLLQNLDKNKAVHNICLVREGNYFFCLKRESIGRLSVIYKTLNWNIILSPLKTVS